MERYLIKTDREEKKTHIFSVGNGTERIGLVYTDFLVREGMRDITNEEIVGPDNRPIGSVELHRKNNLVSVRSGGKVVAAVEMDGAYREDGDKMKMKEYGLPSLDSERYAKLREMGLTHAYGLEKKSALSHLFCFERDGNLASTIMGKGEEGCVDGAFKGMALAIKKRIEDQEFVFEFIK